VQENVLDDILIKQYFPRSHREERKRLGTGLITVIAIGSTAFGGREGTADKWALEIPGKRASKPNK
jgi:hypothetical protein